MKRWGMVDFEGRWVAEYGEWPESGSLPTPQCEAIAFVIAHDRVDAESIVQSMNDLTLEPPRALGTVGRVGQGVGWLGPQDGRVGIAWAGPEGSQPYGGIAANEDPAFIVDEMKMRSVDVLGEGFSRYSDAQLAELELALRTDDPEELERIYARWRAGALGPMPDPEPTPEPECPDCQRAVRFGYPPQCRKHPYKN